MKRITAVMFILLMTAALVFVGCKKQSQTQSQSQQAVPAITGGSGTVVVEVFDRGTDSGKTLAADNAWTDWIKAKVKKDLNIDVTFLSVGRWTENTDIVNLMASQSAPDVCYTYNKGMIDEFRTLGGVLNLAPHIDQYLPDLKKLLGADPVFTGKDFIRRDEQFNTGGAVYGIPSARVALAIRNIFIRKDWLDKLGLAVPNSVDQFYNALVAFRDRDPGNVGRTAVIPYFNGADVRWGMGDLINNSVQKNLTDREIWTNEPIGGDRAISKPGYKEGVRLMNK
jgi:putative aldouronate transport system substrate-binding protein